MTAFFPHKRAMVGTYCALQMVILPTDTHRVYPEIPPHVEYSLTPIGAELVPIVGGNAQIEIVVERRLS